MDAEDAVLTLTETLPTIEGFGKWCVTSSETHAQASRMGMASAYIEIVPTGTETPCGIAHLIAAPEGLES